MPKQLTDVKILTPVTLRVEALAQNQAIEVSEYLVRRWVLEKRFEVANQLRRILVDLQQTENGEDLVVGEKLRVVLFDLVRPSHPNLLEEVDEHTAHLLGWLSSPVVDLFSLQIR